MADIDVFNGDADGICALLQLRQVEPRGSRLLTGVKRDIALLDQLECSSGDRVTVLDISLEKNRDSLLRILDAGAQVFYADHHYPGEIPTHPQFEALINTAPEVSTSALVNGRLRGARAGWAVVGCYGDNLDQTAEKIAATLTVEPNLAHLKALGVMVNYNGYGEHVADLHFAPDALFRRLLPFDDPSICLREDPDLMATLQQAYDDDMRCAEKSPRLVDDEVLAIIALPDTPWARRVSGVYSNYLANCFPERAHAVLTDIPNGYLVSVRAPLKNRTGADEVCRQFVTGGGRSAAAGINCLPGEQVDTLVDALRRQYAR